MKFPNFKRMFKRNNNKYDPDDMHPNEDTNKVGSFPGPVFYMPDIVFESYRKYFAGDRQLFVPTAKPVLDDVRVMESVYKKRLDDANANTALMPGVVSDIFSARRVIDQQKEDIKKELSELPTLILYDNIVRRVEWSPPPEVMEKAVRLW